MNFYQLFKTIDAVGLGMSKEEYSITFLVSDESLDRVLDFEGVEFSFFDKVFK